MLLDPLEEQFHLPACFVKRADRGCRQGKVVGKRHQRLAGLGILETDTTQMLRVVFATVGAGQYDGLISNYALGAIYRCRIDATEYGVRLGAGHEESFCLMQNVKSGEVRIASIHDVDRPSLQDQHVEHIDIAPLAVGDVDEARNVAAQVEQRTHLHRRLGGTKQRPRKQRQTQIDSRGVQCVGGVLQFDAEAVDDVELARLHDQALGKFGMDTLVSRFVCIGQSRALDLVPETHLVELGGLCRQTDFYIAQTLALGQLREGHHPELIGTGKRLHIPVATMSLDDARECSPRQKIHQLGEQRLADVHAWLRVRYPPEVGRNPILPFKSTPPFIARNPASIMAFSPTPSHLTGQ